MNAGKPDSVQVFYGQRSVVKGTGPLKNGHSPSVPAIGPARHFALPPDPLETGGFLRFRETGTKTGDRLAQNHPERRACAPLKDAAAISDSEGEAHDDNCFGSVFSMWWRHEAGADGRRGAYVYSVWFRTLPGISDRFARRPALSNTSSLLGEGGRGSPQATGRSGNRVGEVVLTVRVICPFCRPGFILMERIQHARARWRCRMGHSLKFLSEGREYIGWA